MCNIFLKSQAHRGRIEWGLLGVWEEDMGRHWSNGTNFVRWINSENVKYGDYSHCVCVCLVAHLCLTLCDPWAVAHQTPPSMKFCRQENWSRLPFSALGDVPDPGIKPVSPLLEGRFFTTESPGKPILYP